MEYDRKSKYNQEFQSKGLVANVTLVKMDVFMTDCCLLRSQERV